MSDQAVAIKLGRPKSEQKRVTILESATDLFLNNGFTNTSMDMVAKDAGVSKQTVYSHFNNKDDLYTAVIDAKCRQYRMDATRIDNNKASLQDVLMEIADQALSLLQDPEVIAMYTVVIGEANNNPHVAELFYRAGPLQSLDTVAGIIHSHKPTQLTESQATALATDFFNLIKSDFHMRSMLQLPFKLSQTQQHTLCQRVCLQISLMVDNAQQLPIVSSTKH